MKKKSVALLLVAILGLSVGYFAYSNTSPFAVLMAVSGDDLVWCSDWISMGCGEVNEVKKFNLNTSPSHLVDLFTCNSEKGCRLRNSLGTEDLRDCYSIIFRKNGSEFLRLDQTCYGAPSDCFITPVSKANFDAAIDNTVLNYGSEITIECVPPLGGCLFGTCYTNVNIEYIGSYDRLAWCGQGPTAVSCNAAVSGVTVLGADGCAFNLDNVTNKPPGLLDTIFLNTSGSQSVTKSYVVPVGTNVWIPFSGTKHICGHLGQDCVDDTGCWGRYPFDYGVGYGNANIVGGQLYEYKCLATGPATECKQWSGLQEGQGACLQYTNVLQCSAVSTGKMCECNPMSPGTCGANAFCESNESDPDFCTCQPSGTVACTSEFDPTCVEVVCDRVNKVLKEGYCANPGTISSFCTYRTLQSIECCTKADCLDGFYCTTNYACEAHQPDCTECPYECCQGECSPLGGYFDKPLSMPAGKECCPDHTIADFGQCDAWFCVTDDDCVPGERCEDGECVPDVVCEDREPTGILYVGWRTVTTDTLTYLIPFPWGGGLIETGRTTTIDCVQVLNWGLIMAAVGSVAVVLMFVYFFKRKGKKKKGKRRRR